MPEGAVLDVRTLHGIPVYNADDETATGIPPVVAGLKDAIAAASGLLLSTPEYNNSIPGVTKNGIDWLSRPPADIKRVFGGKPVAIVSASPGGFGGVLSQTAWLPVMKTLGAPVWPGPRLTVSKAGSVFAEDGSLADDAIRDTLKKFLAGFVASLQGR
jgi:NAD(P)H-dependent FMN reductase